MSRGRLIVLEGLDGAGTTTQVARLTEVFRAAGHDVVDTFEPSDSPDGRLVRASIKGLAKRTDIAMARIALLYAADRCVHLDGLLLPALQRGALVFSDRYLMSSLVYQSLHLPTDWVRTINRYAPRPDATLYVDVDPAVAVTRRKRRGRDIDLFEAQRFQERLRALYLGFCPEFDAAVVPGGGTVDEVTERLLSALAAHGIQP